MSIIHLVDRFTPAAKEYTRAVAQAQLMNLQAMLSNLSNNIVISTGFIH
jgi:hypothetical protein